MRQGDRTDRRSRLSNHPSVALGTRDDTTVGSSCHKFTWQLRKNVRTEHGRRQAATFTLASRAPSMICDGAVSHGAAMLKRGFVVAMAAEFSFAVYERPATILRKVK